MMARAIYLLKESKLFSDPQSVTVNTVAKSLPRVGTSLTESKYQSSDRAYTFKVRSTSGRRNLNTVRLENSKIVTDPFASDRQLPVGCSSIFTIDSPVTGYTAAELIEQVVALADWLKAGTNAAKLVGGEL